MTEEKGKIIDVSKVDPGFQELCTEQGLQVSGNGIIIKLLEKIAERLDKIESHAWKESMDIKRLADKLAPK